MITVTSHWGSVHATPEEFENAALFLRLGLPPILIRHENGALSKTPFKPAEFENAGFFFRVDGKHFENGAFWKRWRQFPCPSFLQTQIQNDLWWLRFQISPPSCGRKTFDASQSENSGFKFLQRQCGAVHGIQFMFGHPYSLAAVWFYLLMHVTMKAGLRAEGEGHYICPTVKFLPGLSSNSVGNHNQFRKSHVQIQTKLTWHTDFSHIAVASSPSGWASLCFPEGAIPTGIVNFCPRTVVVRSTWDIPRRMRGLIRNLKTIQL